MKRKRFSPEQIATVLKQAELGIPIKDLCRQHSLSEQSFYRWKKQYDGLGISELRELRETRDENKRLKRLLVKSNIQNLKLIELYLIKNI